MKSLFTLLLLLSFITLNSQIYLDTTYSRDERVEDLLSQMTLEEKAGQMTQVNWQDLEVATDMKTYFIGSLLNGGGAVPSPNTPAGWADMYDGFQALAMDTRLGIPMIYGTDAVHGHNNLYGAVIFPHSIGLGSTRNESLVEEIAGITAVEVAATGVDWTFAPCVAVPRDERWGRTYEGFSEDPELVSILGAAAVRGFQGTALDDSLSILACAKHYVGDGGTVGGDDQGNMILSEEELRRIHLPPYLSTIEAGTGSIMASYNSWNGDKLHGDYYLLTTVLKEELGFDGFIVSDWAAIDQLPGDYISDIENSINAGIDMVMVPADYKAFINGLISLVNEGKVSMERIDDANKRILRKKFEMGLFEKPYTERALFSEVGKAEHRETARQAVRESLVLLKNKNGILPIAKDASHLHVAGSSANNLGYQCGGWSLTWQGGSGDITIGTTVLEAIQSTATGQITYLEQGYGASADGAETAVVVIGERPYAEGAGDDNDLSLNQESVDAIKSLYEMGIKVVTILISGRPMILDDIWHYSDAVIAAWLPGTEGQGVADILFGDYQPSGKLSYTWPASMDQIPINIGDDPYEPFLPFGFGLESFSLPSAEEAPRAISSATGESGEYIELSFDKSMKIPDPSVLSLSVNGFLSGISEVRLKEGDSNTLILFSENSLNETDRIQISSEGGVEAEDGSVSEAFTLDVYNAIIQYYAVPGKIEAENYYDMSGIQTENCTDIGGGLNVGWIEPGDYMVYNVDINEEGEYLIDYRVASESQGGNLKLQMMENDQYSDLHSVSFNATGGWQNWITVSEKAELPAGRYKLRIYAASAGFNVNWFELSSTVGTDVFDSGIGDKIILFPNPVEDILNIKAGDGEEFHFSIYDITGRPFSSGQFRSSLSVYVSSYPSGIYLIMIDSGKGKVFRKFRIK
jgi:beta-glucosidase